MSKYYASTIIALAQNEIGYLEKASNSQLDSKTANAGYNNWTKYARDLDNIPGFFNGPKNGYPWCASFYCWLFVKSFGVEQTRKMLYLPVNSLAAGCDYALGYYKKNGAFYSEPKAGDQIFFSSSRGGVAHTGLVEKVTASTVYTIEGNTSTSAGVIANGGGVCRKSYSIGYSRIIGYGRPKYDVESTPVVQPSNRILTVADIQSWLNKDYAAGLVVDNDFGALTKKAIVKAVQKNLGVGADGVFGVLSKAAWKNIKRGSVGEVAKLVQAMLICYGYSCGNCGADGDFGTGSVLALKRFQSVNKLVADGIAGKATAMKLFA
nr:MAG TPA: PlyB-like endolysin [Bacteriophage sp.]